MNQQKLQSMSVELSKLAQILKCSSLLHKRRANAFSAGSHITVHMGEQAGLQRAYSLISDPQQCGSYCISVLRDETRKVVLHLCMSSYRQGIACISPSTEFSR